MSILHYLIGTYVHLIWHGLARQHQVDHVRQVQHLLSQTFEVRLVAALSFGEQRKWLYVLIH